MFYLEAALLICVNQNIEKVKLIIFDFLNALVIEGQRCLKRYKVIDIF